MAGQTAAFGQLVTKYQDRLYNTMVRVVGNRDEAHDVVQDAFVQAFVKLETFRRTAAFYTWLYLIAFNLAISHRRRKKPVVSIDQAREDAGEEPVGEGPAPTDHLEQEERAAQIQSALNELSDEHRDIIVLREIDGCCYDTIAEVLEMPVGTVRSRLHRARIHLREKLKDVLQEDLA